MASRRLEAALTVGFALLVAAPAFPRLISPQPQPVTGNSPQAVSAGVAKYGFYLEDVTAKSGIHFTHQSPTLDPKLQHIMPQIASMGAAVSVVDYDRDGWPDLYVTNSGEGSKNHLYHNNHDGTFTDVAEQVGLADVNQPGTGVSMGAVWGDYDNDGYEDLLLYKWGRPELYHNDGGKHFTPVGEKAGLPKWLNANSAVWLDYDHDGKLDLFIGGYFDERIDLWHLRDTKIMPDSFEYAKNGGRKYLLRNKGDGTFEDVTEKVGLDSRRWALSAAAADLRGTGYPDLVIANDYGVSEFWANEGGKRFREIGHQVNIQDHPKSGMNVAFGDYDNTGQFAIYVTNISEPGTLIQGNNLWVPDASHGGSLTYNNFADGMGVNLGGWSFGAQWGDLNNDGKLDLTLMNGYVSANRQRSYWYGYSKIAGANSAIINDAANWPPMEDMSLSGYQPKHLWVNGGGGRFTDVAPMVGVTETYDGRSVVLADLWNRGVLDQVTAHQKGPLLVYRNQVAPGNDWVEFELEGTRSNRSAIGAQVRVFWDGQQQLQEVSGGSGFCAQNDRRLHFGLGKNARIDRVEIRWPSGQKQTLTAPQVGQLHHVKEPAA